MQPINPIFFDKGLRFECQRCGACCTGEPGFIFVEKHDIVQIAEYFSQEALYFIETYLYPFRTGYSIKEHADGRCIFYQEGCSIYPVRPAQCRTFPFWFENLRSFNKWRRVTRECPGIDKGPVFSKEQILEFIHASISDTIKSHL
ncbi:MAG: YkgJ family cysteine cluster protein [Desulfobacterales bacterium]|nr:MAG: YkgJ family cysteine cluster protein [Desulfobacterales bacterium]